MMTDLVTRLRQRLGDAWRLNDEAADELERLRDALEGMQENYRKVDQERCRLRFRLMEIDAYCDDELTDVDKFLLQEIAREALGGD